jgi:beta-phosphoglucomutase-like phosphatase (HAD superfamily)
VLGLPDAITACFFDLDGVLTQTAKVHAAAWQQMFDEYLRARAAKHGEEFVPFDPVHDYDEYVDGKPRYDGVRSFLASRDIELPQGGPSDRPGADTVYGLGNRKNEIVLKLIHERGVEPYEGSVRYVSAAPDADTYLARAKALGAEPRAAVVFEDALAGVEAGRAGHFGFVVGVDRVGQASALRAHGADIVVSDLAQLLSAS